MDLAGPSAGGGAGGKISRRPVRARPSPYARPALPPVAAPPAAAVPAAVAGWFAKIVVRPAAWALTSLFAPADRGPSTSEDSPENEQEDAIGSAENQQEDVNQDTAINHENQFPESKVLGASDETVQPMVEFKSHERVEDDGLAHHAIGISEIEQRLKHKMYTREESTRLIELLRSRTTDPSDHQRQAAGLAVDAAEARICHSRTFAKDVVDHRITLKTFEPFQLTTHDVSSSPIDIAKAYMEGQKSVSGYDSHNGTLMIERKPVDGDLSALSPSSAVKSPICWPGVVVHGDRGYLTPRVQRGRSGLHNVRRTPYSGGVFSRSTSKGVGESTNLSSVGWKQSHTPVFGRNMKSKSSVLNDGLAQDNLIHHVRQKSLSTAASGGAGPSLAPTFSWSGISSTGQNLERGSSRSTALPTVHPQSSRMAQKILEHLERSVSPKEKSQELDLVLSKQESPPKMLEHLDRSVSPKEKSQEPELAFLRTEFPSKIPENPELSVSPKEKSQELKFVFSRPEPPPISTTSSTDGQDTTRYTRKIDRRRPGSLLGREMGTHKSEYPHKVLSGTSTSKPQGHSHSELVEPSDRVGTSENGSSFTFPVSPASYAFPKSPPPPTTSSSPAASGMPPTTDGTLPPFSSTSKIKTYDNGFGFSFPAPPVSNALSEPPPTPTMSSSRATNRALPTGDETIPTFNFGNRKAGERLVFSFGTTANSATTDSSIPTFKFGSGAKRELSFKSIAKDAICS